MRKYFLFLLLLLCIMLHCVNAKAQGIRFEKNTDWKKVCKKAIREKKMVFVDCYTSWCGPCKALMKNVFPQEEVGDFFNKHFVNVKYDMEKDADGIRLKDHFGVKVFPTLVFVNPETEEVEHVFTGSACGRFMEESALALDSLHSLWGMTRRYEAGEREVGFLKNYLERLKIGYRTEKQEQVACDYLDSLPAEELFTLENWELIEAHVKDPLAKPLRTMMKERERFYKIAGEAVVDKKIDGTMNLAYQFYFLWKPLKPGETSIRLMTEFDEKRYAEMMLYLDTINYEHVPALIAMALAGDCRRSGNIRGMVARMKESGQYNVFRDLKREHYYLATCIESVKETHDEALIDDCRKWLEEQAVRLGGNERGKIYTELAGRLKSQARIVPTKR